MHLVYPPNFLHNHRLRFVLAIGRLQYLGEIGNNDYAKFFGINKMHYGLSVTLYISMKVLSQKVIRKETLRLFSNNKLIDLRLVPYSSLVAYIPI